MRLARQAAFIPATIVSVLFAFSAAADPTGGGRPVGGGDGPAWIVRPEPDFPIDASIANIQEGSVSLRCYLQPPGVISRCDVVSETPEGWGFADAAISAARRARLTYPSGTEPDATITFTVRFEMADEGTDWSDTPPGPRVRIECLLNEARILSDCQVAGPDPFRDGWPEIVIASMENQQIGDHPAMRANLRVSFVFARASSGEPVPVMIMFPNGDDLPSPPSPR